MSFAYVKEEQVNNRANQVRIGCGSCSQTSVRQDKAYPRTSAKLESAKGRLEY